MELDTVLVSFRLFIQLYWLLTFPCSLFTAGTMTGFDASGHIAEETKNAR